MIRLALLFALAAAVPLAPIPARAEPGVIVRYLDGTPQIQLEGSYALMHYTVWRDRDAFRSSSTAITMQGLLCMGTCFADDPGAEPGRTYWYRFELDAPDGSRLRYGPYRITISRALAGPAGVNVVPNPGSGPTRIELHLAGSRADAPLPVTATLHDLQGRVLCTLHRGPLARGFTSLTWDGRAADGRRLEAGCYFVRFATPLGTSTARVLRIR